MYDDRKWCEASGNSSDISVTDRGTASHSESGSNWSLDSSAIGDCPAADTGVSYCTVTAAGARCDFVAINELG